MDPTIIAALVAGSFTVIVALIETSRRRRNLLKEIAEKINSVDVQVNNRSADQPRLSDVIDEIALKVATLDERSKLTNESVNRLEDRFNRLSDS